jgi:hypothetical protein
MALENAEFFIEQSYLRKKIGRIKRKVKTGSHMLLSILKHDYSDRKLAISWDNLPTRFDLMNRIITACDYEDYLEIGCSTDACFQSVVARTKLGVDPFSGGTHRMTSDEFFAANRQKFDIIFIDGLHQYAQVKNDLINGIEALNDDGVILVHDCLPLGYRAQLPFPAGGAWNGDVWKAFVEVRTQAHVDSAVCLIDHGVGMVKKRANQNRLNLELDNFIELRYRDFTNKYEEWLNTMSYEKALQFAEVA